MAKEKKRNITAADRHAATCLTRIWRQAQQGRKFTQEDAAHELGVSQGLISQWLNAKTAIGLKATFQLAKYLKCRPADIRPDIALLGLDSGDLSEDALRLALHWQDLTPAAQDAVARLAYSYPPSKNGQGRKSPIAATR